MKPSYDYDRSQVPLAFAIAAVCDQTFKEAGRDAIGLDIRIGLKFSLLQRMGVSDLSVAMAAVDGSENLSEGELKQVLTASMQMNYAPEQQPFLEYLEGRVRQVLTVGGYACPPAPA